MPPRKSQVRKAQPADDDTRSPSAPPPGRELVNPMDRFVGYKIRRIKQAVIGELNDILRPFELRIMDFATLCIVEANPGLYQNEITRLLGAEPPAVVLSLDRLEKGGYLIRRLSENDRRLRTLHLTPSGRQLQKRVNAKVEQQELQIRHAVKSGFPELVAALDDLMRHYDLD